MPRRLAKPAWRCARSRVAFRFLVWRRARLASPRSGFYLCSCQLVLSLGIRLRNSSQPDHPMLSLWRRFVCIGWLCFYGSIVDDSASRRADAVKAGRVIRPVRVAEIEPPIQESVGADRRPRCISQIIAGIDHDRQVSCPGYDKSERVGSHTKVGAAEDQRVRKEP